MHIVMSCSRKAHQTRWGQSLQAGRDVHAVAEQVPAPDHRLSDVHANPERHPTVLGNRLVDGRDPLLDRDGTPNCVDGTGKLREDAVTRCVGDPSAMQLDLTIRDLAVGGEQAQGATLVPAHEPGIAGHIGTEDRRETALDSGGRLAHLLTNLARISWLRPGSLLMQAGIRFTNLPAVQLLLGHTKIESTVPSLGIDVDDALSIAEQVEV